MRALVLTFLLAGAVCARADDDIASVTAPTTTSNNILKNGDFSSGINHWEGDCHTIDSSSFADNETPPTAGVVVKLRGSDWCKVWQTFTSKIGEYNVAITYGASSDLKMSDSMDDYTNISGHLGFNGLMPFSTPAHNWVVLINDRAAMHYNYWQIAPKLDASGQQTLNLRIQIDSGEDAEKGFFLLFPPGTGFINLLNVAMTAVSTQANP